MASVTIDVKAAGIAQGGWNHGQAGSESNKCRCIDAFYIDVNGVHPSTITSTLAVSTGKMVNISLMTFETPAHTTEILSSGWQNVPYTMNISSSTASKYVLCEMRYSDSSNVTPDEILSWTITYDDGLVYHGHEGEYPINDKISPIIQTDFERPYPSMLWRIDESNDGYPYNDLQFGILTYEPPAPPPVPSNPECANWLSHWFIRKEDMDLNRESVMGYIS